MGSQVDGDAVEPRARRDPVGAAGCMGLQKRHMALEAAGPVPGPGEDAEVALSAPHPGPCPCTPS